MSQRYPSHLEYPLILRNTVGLYIRSAKAWIELAFQQAILEEQLVIECRIKKPYISDRCLIDPMAYTRFRNSENRESNYRLLFDRQDVQHNLADYRDTSETLIVLLEPVEEFAFDDGTRSVAGDMSEWMECLRCFESVLRDAGVHWKTLGPETKDLNERVRMIIRWINDEE